MTILRYFETPFKEFNIGIVYKPDELIEQVNTYAENRKLEIVSISTNGKEGLYVAFKKRNIN